MGCDNASYNVLPRKMRTPLLLSCKRTCLSTRHRRLLIIVLRWCINVVADTPQTVERVSTFGAPNVTDSAAQHRMHTRCRVPFLASTMCSFRKYNVSNLLHTAALDSLYAQFPASSRTAVSGATHCERLRTDESAIEWTLPTTGVRKASQRVNRHEARSLYVRAGRYLIQCYRPILIEHLASQLPGKGLSPPTVDLLLVRDMFGCFDVARECEHRHIWRYIECTRCVWQLLHNDPTEGALDDA